MSYNTTESEIEDGKSQDVISGPKSINLNWEDLSEECKKIAEIFKKKYESDPERKINLEECKYSFKTSTDTSLKGSVKVKMIIHDKNAEHAVRDLLTSGSMESSQVLLEKLEALNNKSLVEAVTFKENFGEVIFHGVLGSVTGFMLACCKLVFEGGEKWPSLVAGGVIGFFASTISYGVGRVDGSRSGIDKVYKGTCDIIKEIEGGNSQIGNTERPGNESHMIGDTEQPGQGSQIFDAGESN